MDIRTIEKDVLTKAKNNINPSTSSQLARELQQKWGKYAFDITNKLQKQGYLVRCDFFFGGDFWLGYLTPAGTEYLKELNYSAKKNRRTFIKTILIQQFLLLICNKEIIIQLLKVK